MPLKNSALIGAAPKTCRSDCTSESCCLKLSMADCEDEWKLLWGYHVYKVMLDPSRKLFNHGWMFFRGMPSVLSVRWTRWCLTYKAVLIKRAALSSRCTGIERTWHSWAPHHQQVVCMVLVVCSCMQGHCFRAGVFCMGLPNRSLDHLHSSEFGDVKEATA